MTNPVTSQACANPHSQTQHLQIAIAECGWPEAARLRQQDASEAFNFITDKLQLPLLTLKTDIYHQGKEDANDDHKFITERMLDVAIPDGLPQGEVLKLESCLEDYFNNRVEVKRLLARRNTVNSVASTESTEKSNMTHVETVEVDSRTSSPAPSEKQSMVPQRPANLRVRATSIFSERRVTVSTNAGATQEDESPATTRAKKEVLMPAWQFLNLIRKPLRCKFRRLTFIAYCSTAWYTDNLPEGANQVRSHFSRKRLMLGICLKRYGMTSSGSSFRRSTHIDIPLEMASPHFTTGDQIDGDGTDAQSFKLVLKSFVCHRGHSVDAGHYISFVRIDSLKRDQHDTFTASSRERPHDQSHDAWLRFDDLAAERVVSVDINKVLKEESPYILFYRVQPIQEELPEDLPPPYQETEGQLDYVDQKLAHLEDQRRLSVEQHSARPSIEVTSPVDSQDSRGRKSLPESRRLSVLAPSVDGSIKADPVEQAPTESPSLNSTRAVSPAMSRQQTRSLRAEGRAAIDESGRRFSVTMSKLRIPNMGKEKLAASDVVVKEIAAHAQQTLVGDDEDVTKSKEKRKKLKSFKRRGSHNEGLAKPDRECIVM